MGNLLGFEHGIDGYEYRTGLRSGQVARDCFDLFGKVDGDALLTRKPYGR